jgi:hypothetical protein
MHVVIGHRSACARFASGRYATAYAPSSARELGVAGTQSHVRAASTRPWVDSGPQECAYAFEVEPAAATRAGALAS